MADTAGVGIAPHNPLGPLAGVAALHFDIATPNFVIQEEMSGAVPVMRRVANDVSMTRCARDRRIADRGARLCPKAPATRHGTEA